MAVPPDSCNRSTPWDRRLDQKFPLPDIPLISTGFNNALDIYLVDLGQKTYTLFYPFYRFYSRILGFVDIPLCCICSLVVRFSFSFALGMPSCI